MSFLEKGEAKFTGELLSMNGNQPVEIVLVKKKHLKIKKKNVFKSKIVKFPADEQINVKLFSFVFFFSNNLLLFLDHHFITYYYPIV